MWICLRFLLPLFSPFLLGTVLALAAEPMVHFLTRRLRIPRSVSAGIGISTAFCFLAMLFLLLCGFLLRELGTLSGRIPGLEDAARSGIQLTESRLLQLTAYAPQSIRPLLRTNVHSFFSDGTALLERITGYLLGLAGNILSHVPDSALRLGTGVISAFLISAKLPKIQSFLRKRIPRPRLEALLESGRRMKQVLGRWLLAQTKLMGVTFLILFLGFVLLRLPNALIWALGICLVDAFPILGTGTILLPWSLLQFLQQDNARAIGLLGIYATVTLTRSILEPKFVGRHLGLDPLVTLILLYAGYTLWGIAGMLFTPLLAVTVLQLTPEKQ